MSFKPNALTPNQEGQVIFIQGYLPLAFDENAGLHHCFYLIPKSWVATFASTTVPKIFFSAVSAVVVFTRIPGQGSVLYPTELGPNLNLAIYSLGPTEVIDAYPRDVDAPG